MRSGRRVNQTFEICVGPANFHALNRVHVSVEDVGVVRCVDRIDHKGDWLVFVDLIGHSVHQVGRIVHMIVDLARPNVRLGTLDIKLVCRVINKHFKLDGFCEAGVGAVSA